MGALAGASLRSRLGRVGVSSLGVSAAVEALQLFTPDRTPSAMDVVGQVAGALAGALAGHVLVSAAGRHLTAWGLIALRRDPALGPVAALMAILAADALFPYTPTLDLGAVWNSVKHAAWLPLQGSRLPPWHSLVVADVLPGAVLAALLLALFRRSSATARLGAWGLATGYGVGLQLAKLFIEGRSPNANHAFAVSAGALLGVLAGPALSRLSLARTHAALACTVGAAALLVYEELQPFDFRVTMAIAKAATIEWLPFASYYEADPERALFDVGKKLLLGGLLGAALRAGHLPHPALWALGFATLLEALQLLESSRQPALTDVLSLTAGAALGAAILVRYRALLAGPESGGRWHKPGGMPPESSPRARAGGVLD